MTTLSEQLKTSRELGERKNTEIDSLRRELKQAQERTTAADKKCKETQFDNVDLKIRLAAAEKANQFLRGYLARVAEDDTVREDLVEIGDPNGERQLVPKRKPTRFEVPDDFTYPRGDRDSGVGYVEHHNRPKPRHWVNY